MFVLATTDGSFVKELADTVRLAKPIILNKVNVCSNKCLKTHAIMYIT